MTAGPDPLEKREERVPRRVGNRVSICLSIVQGDSTLCNQDDHLEPLEFRSPVFPATSRSSRPGLSPPEAEHVPEPRTAFVHPRTDFDADSDVQALCA